jgi:hypothetical protein
LTSNNAQNPTRILSSSWDFVHFWKFYGDFVPFWKFLMGFCAFLQDPGGILCIFGSSSWDFVHFWKFLLGFGALFEVRPNPRRNFQKCTKSHIELPKMHKIP